MKWAIGSIVGCAAAVVGWVLWAGSADDLTMAVVAVCSVIFFGSLPVLLGARSRASRVAIRREDCVVVRVPAQPTPSDQSAQPEEGPKPA